jgi:hypothetical protein
MSTRSTYPGGEPVGQPATARSTERYADEGSGWLTFAGIMLAIVGLMNIVYGIAAIDSANFYVNNARYVFSDLNTWGWIMLCIGAVQFAAAFAVFSNVTWGRWIGILSASGNAIFQLFFIPSYPLLALALFAIDILVIYGLVAHGGRRAQLA